MIVFVDSESRIKAVDKTSDSSLTPLFIIDETSPFKGWSNAKICCYRVTVTNGYVTMMTPYVDSRLIDSIDAMGQQIDEALPIEMVESASMGDTEVIFVDVPDGVLTVDARDLEGNVLSFHVNRNEDLVRVFFDEALSYAADIRLVVN